MLEARVTAIFEDGVTILGAKIPLDAFVPLLTGFYGRLRWLGSGVSPKRSCVAVNRRMSNNYEPMQSANETF